MLPPSHFRSNSAEVAAGWQDAPYPREHRGRIGELVDFVRAVYHVIPILAPLVRRLMHFLGLGVQAYTMLFRLVLFAVALSPAITKAGVWWWKSRTISRGIKYGDKPRNFLDVYHACDTDYTPRPSDEVTKLPVVIYITGGAWIIGYKAWAAPLGEYLSKHGVVVVSVDYRNFPQGTLRDMMDDVSAAMDWTWENIDRFGGDRERIVVVGQSAGAHIASSLMMRKAADAADSASAMPLSKWNKFIGVSGPYDIVSLAPRFNKRGLYSSMLRTIMDNDLFGASPARLISSMKSDVVARLPPILLLHGTVDDSVPFPSSMKFLVSLKAAGAEADIELWPGVGHSDPIVEGPAAGSNYFGSRVLMAIDGHDHPVVASPPLMNERMIKFAKLVMPF